MKKRFVSTCSLLLALGMALTAGGCDLKKETDVVNGKTLENATLLGPNGGVSGQETYSQYDFQPRTIKADGPSYTDGSVTYSADLWKTPEYEYEPTLDVGAGDVEGVRGLFFTSPVKYDGKETKVAAYVGFPEGASAENKVPAIVLVHGGEGTAIPEWVRYWNKQGFAAISLDTEGAEPIIGVSNYKNYHVNNRYKKHDVYTAGPSNSGFTDCDKPLEDQWMYHATSATILATSLLSSFDCVDQQKIGITGISWGSVITTIVSAYDDRLTFAMPVYGAATLSENDGFVKFGKTADAVSNALSYWDVKEGLRQSNCKMFFIAAQTGDTAFSVNVANEAAELTNATTLFKDGFLHSQEVGANEKNLPYFAKTYCGMNTQFVEITQQPTKDNLRFRYASYGEVELNSITVCYTTESSLTTRTEWVQTEEKASGDGGAYTIKAPKDATFAFARIKYNNGQQISTRIVDLR